MYWLMLLDTLARLVAGMAFLFILVPALAWKRPATLDRLQWFWWCFASGLIALILLGHALSLLHSFTAVPVLLAIGAFVLFARARREGLTPWALADRLGRNAVLVVLNLLEGRIDVRRRIRRMVRRARGRLRARISRVPIAMAAAWTAVLGLAVFFRFFRPFATANLGFSDVYPHLFYLRLLKQGIQVDPEFGPYPRGMHLLMLTIHELTNANLTLLTNCFGSLIGVMIIVSLGDAARRLTTDSRAGIFAAALAAATTGGSWQYFLFGGVFNTKDAGIGNLMAAVPYADRLARSTIGGRDFDILLFAFQRLTVTYPQELALVLLFPAALFLLDWFRTGDRWCLSGYLAATAAIAAIHSGVVIPLIILSAVSALAAWIEGRIGAGQLRRAALLGAAAVAAGSVWMVGYVVYDRKQAEISGGLFDAIGQFFPYFRPFIGERPYITILERGRYVEITPFLIAVLAIAMILAARTFFVPRVRRGTLIWPVAATGIFFYIHVASRFGLPEIFPLHRSLVWFAMSIILLITTFVLEIAKLAGSAGPRRVQRWAFPLLGALIVGVWLARLPDVRSNEFQSRLDETGYGLAAYAALRVEWEFEPFTWTLVTYGQEFPMVMGAGFHIPASDLLDRYDPRATSLPISTRYLFIVVEKNPHEFELDRWSDRFSRQDVEQRLQTWCYLYQMSHDNIRVYLEDENVRVYVIEQSEDDLRALTEGARG